MRVRRAFMFAVATVAAAVPMDALAQVPMPQLGKGTAEVGYLHDWFHRDFGNALPAETDWSVASVVISYGVQDWIALLGQGGVGNVDEDDSYYDRLTVGAGVTLRMYQTGRWSFSANARYVDIFDHDQWSNQFHKSMRTLAASAQLTLAFGAWDQSGVAWLGPIVSDDHADLYFNDSHQPVESSAGAGWGASAGANVVLFGWIAVYGYATYIDDFAGGAGISLHAGKGSF